MPTNRKSHRDKTLAGMAAGLAKDRRPGRPVRVSDDAIRAVMHLGTMAACRRVGLTKAQYILRRKRLEGLINV